MVDARESLLNAIKNAFSCVIPVLDAAQNWGALDKSQEGEDVKENFKSSIRNVIKSFDGKIVALSFSLLGSESICFLFLEFCDLLKCTFTSAIILSRHQWEVFGCDGWNVLLCSCFNGPPTPLFYDVPLCLCPRLPDAQ